MAGERVEENAWGSWVVREGKPQDIEPLRDYESIITDLLVLAAWCLRGKERVFVDVGANVGRYVVPAAKVYSKVYAVEPDPDNLEALYRNIELNSVSDRVVVVPKALGSAPGRARLAQSGAQSRIADEGVEVDVDTLDNCCPGAKVVKIDVEGYELEVVKGALRTIEENKPILIIEHHEYVFGLKPTWHPEIARILRDKGYVAIRVRYPHFLYIHRDVFEKCCALVRHGIGSHIFHEKILPNIVSGKPWYYGLSGTWWYGMDIPEYIKFAPKNIGCEEAYSLAEEEMDKAVSGKVFRF